MLKINKNEFFIFFKNKNLVLVLVLVFWWSFLSGVDFGKTDFFQDSDRDGLTDAEENSLGTNPSNPDSDGDGYSDGVEVEAGYDPLKPSPDDKLIIKTQEEEKTEKLDHQEPNLTEEFFNKLVSEKNDELAVLGDYYNSENKPEGDDSLNNVSITTEEIQEILNSTANQTGLGDELELIPMENLKILEKTNNQKKEKAQIEKYLTQIFYIISLNKPFSVEDVNKLPQLGVDYVLGLSSKIQSGEIDQFKDLKNKTQKTYEDCLEVEVPYATRNIHQKVLSLMKYLSEDIQEEKLVDQEDPLGMALYLGKLQAVLIEAELLKEEIDELMEEYEIETFDKSNLENIF